MVDWQESANCKGMHPNLFTIAHLGDVEVAHIGDLDTDKYNKLKRHNRKKVARAVEHCRGCPVWAECLDSANGEDRLYTVRGGVEPQGFEPLAPKPPKPAKVDGRTLAGEARRAEKLANPCEKCGEKDWKLINKHGRKALYPDCQECARRRRRAFYERNTEQERARNRARYHAAKVEG